MHKLSQQSLVALIAMAALGGVSSYAQSQVLTGQDAFTDYSKEHPGVMRHLTVKDLPPPYACGEGEDGQSL